MSSVTDPTTQLEIFGPVFEESTALFTAEVVDAENNPILTLSTLSVSLFDNETSRIINDRDRQNILNANDGTFNEGILTFTMSPDDTMILNQSKDVEDHILRFDFTYNGGTATGRHAVIVRVRNLKRVS